MAIAVRVSPKPAPPPDEIQLTLTTEEASTLLWVLYKVGGHPEKTPRGKIDAIIQALDSAQVSGIRWEVEKNSSIYFA